MANDISNRDDIIDSRDIVEKIKEYESELEDIPEEDTKARDEWSDENQEDYKALLRMVDEIDGYSGDSAKDGVTLIRDSYFETYCQEFAEDIGAINKDSSWPNNCIDWEKAARELQMDYTSLEFDGVTYWFR